jgi:type VII secretion protein EccB
VIVTVIIAAGFGVYSIFTGGGNQKWKVDGAVVVEKDSGAAFLYHENKLHPALNLTSAVLASPSPKPPVFTVSSKSLQDVAWGPTIGIPFLPDSLATKKQLASFPWSVCAMQAKDGPVSVIVAGSGDVSKGRLVPEKEAMLVRSTTKSANTYVLWRGRLHEIKASTAERLAPSVQPTAVAPAFLNGLPKGEPIEPIYINPSLVGTKSRFNELWRVGEVISVFGVTAEDRYVLVGEDGLYYVSQVQAVIAAFNGQRRSYGEVTDNNRLRISNSLLPKDTNDPRQPPSDLPEFATYKGAGLCSVVLDENGRTELRADVPLDLQKRPQTSRRSTSNAIYADYVLMPNGQGAIVASGQTYSYVSRDGVRFAAANLGVLTKLGYDNVAPIRLSSSLVALLPEGPGLDPAEASVPITVS